MSILKTSEHTPEVDYFGVCPKCHKNDGYINVGKSQWFYCKEHRACWCIGVNLFSSWKYETLEGQEEVYDALGMENYTEVVPYTEEETND